MKKTITKKELMKIDKLVSQHTMTRIKAVNLLDSIMNKFGKIEFKIENLDIDTKLSYFDKYDHEVNCILVGIEKTDDDVMYIVINEDDLEFDDDEMIIGGKVTQIESYWFDYDCVFDVLEIIKKELK